MGLSIVVTDSGQRAALAITRSLGRALHQVHVVGPRVPSLAGSSRFAASDSVVPDAGANRLEFATAVAAVARSVGAAMVIPTTDAAVLALAEHRSILAPIPVPIPDLDTVGRVADKANVLERAAAVGIAVPAQVRIPEPGAIDSFEWDRFPAVLKPARSVTESGLGSAKHSVSYASDRSDLIRRLRALPPTAYPVLVQERITGPGVGLFLLRWNGETIARFGHRRIREKPPSGGVSVRSVSAAVSDEAFGLAERLLDDLRWAGPAMVEFKQDTATGRLVLMEINGRFWGSLQLAIDSGVDFPALLVAAATGGNPAPVLAYRVGVGMRWWWGEMDHLLAIGRATPARDRVQVSVRTLVDILAAPLHGVRGEVCRASDPMPAVREALDWIRGR